MASWTIFFTFILTYSQFIFHMLQASQPFGYMGCYPSSCVTVPRTSVTSYSNGIYCIGNCKTSDYRYAATQGQYCKCANEILDVKESDTMCNFTCPGRVSEKCGGTDLVSLYDTQSSECFEDHLGMTVLKDDDNKTHRIVDHNNSATQCESYCKEKQYIFSGTKNTFCICGNSIKHGINKSIECVTKCPGDKEKICGGGDGVLIRLTGYVNTSKTAPSTTITSSTKTASNTTTSNTMTPSTTTSSTKVMPSTTASSTTLTSSTKTTPNTTTQSTVRPSTTTTSTTTSSTEVTQKTPAGSSATHSTQTTEEKFNDESTEDTTSVFPFTYASNISFVTKASASKRSQLTAVYITLPVGIIAAGSVVLIVWLVLRYRRQKREISEMWPASRSSKWEPNSERNEMSCRVQSEEITSQAIQADDKCDDEYSTVSNSNDIMDSNQDYDLINANPSASTNTHGVYSHFQLTTGSPDSNTTDNTYSHIGSASRQCTNQTDNTYNTFQVSQLTKNTGAPSLEHDDQNSVYDSTTARDKRQVNEMSDYAHLDTVNTFK